MSTSKAYRMANTPEFREYEEALKKYKAQSKLFHNFRFNLGNCTNATAEILMLKARRDYSQQCKEFAKAREKYKASCALAQLGEYSTIAGLKLEDIVALLGLEHHVTMKDMIDIQRQNKMADSFKPGEVEAIKTALLERYAQKQTEAAPAAVGEQEYEQAVNENGHEHEYEYDVQPIAPPQPPPSQAQAGCFLVGSEDDPTKEF